MHYQLYIPDCTSPDLSILDQFSLSDLRLGAEVLPSGEGPSEAARPGLVIAWRKPGKAEIGFQPHRQTWIPSLEKDTDGRPAYWIGLWNDSPIIPPDLARPYQKPGHWVSLGPRDQATEWLIPAAKELPADMILADDGSWRYQIQRDYHEFYIEYLRWLERVVHFHQGQEIDFSEAANFVMKGLRINYRLLPEIAGHIRLFNTENVMPALLSIAK